MSVDFKPLYFLGINCFHCTFGPGVVVQPDDIVEVAMDIIRHEDFDKLDFVTRTVFEKLIDDTDETFIRSLFEHMFWGMPRITGVDEINRRYRAYEAVLPTAEEYSEHRHCD